MLRSRRIEEKLSTLLQHALYIERALFRLENRMNELQAAADRIKGLVDQIVAAIAAGVSPAALAPITAELNTIADKIQVALPPTPQP